ncbi:MAG: hypothetical protein K9J13_08015 [Saprospiraceae bacterium]|nr:hypothetical protein [Saprospiraceae bacterium]
MKRTILFMAISLFYFSSLGQVQWNNTQINGLFSSAIGDGTISNGTNAFSSGSWTLAEGDYSTAFGQNSTAIGLCSFVNGKNNTAQGNYSIAFGEQCSTNGNNSLTSGHNNVVNGSFSACFGEDNNVEGNWSFACGKSCVSDLYSTAMGNTASAAGSASFAFGENIIVGGNNSYGFGSSIINTGSNSMLFGNELEIINGTISNSILIGSGLTGNRLQGESNTFMVGFNSNIPTFTVFESNGLNTTGKVRVGYNSIAPDAKFEVYEYHSTANNISAKFIDADYRQLFIVPKLGISGYSNSMCLENDIGIFFSDGQEMSFHKNLNAGLVIGPYGSGLIGGIRIDKTGYVGIGTPTPGCMLQVNGGAAIGYDALTSVPTNGLLVNQSVGINTDYAKMQLIPNCKLAVNGLVYATELKVDVYGSWQDKVFDDSYNLISIKELEEFIKANKHLPNVPTAEEVIENGVNVGEINEILLQKIEELTLYLIEQKKINDRLKDEVEKLKTLN